MRVDRRAVRGVLLKANRAHNHFMALKQATDAWDERRPYRAVTEQADAIGAKYFSRLILEEPIPVEWGVILGEAVHDLRSALDHAVYWLTVDHGGVELLKTGFPIFTHRTKDRTGRPGFEPKGRAMIRGVGSGPQTLIESLQPYPQRRRRTNYSLRVLHEFWNQDKHRLIHLWGFGVFSLQISPRPTFWVPSQTFNPMTVEHPIQDHAIAATVYCDPPRPNMKMDSAINGRIALKNPFPRLHGDRNLFTIWDDTANVVAKLVRAIGNQDAPIDPDTYDEAFLRPGVTPDPPEQWPESPKRE